MKLTSLLLMFVCCAALVSACSKSGNNQGGPGAAITPSPATISTADLEKLKWIEGTWRGTGGEVQKPFYERYHFENPSTLVMEELADENATTASRTTRYELKDFKFGSDRYVATALDEKSITFSPLAAGRNSFRWQSDSTDAWTAILTLPATSTTPAKETVYKMQRIK